MEMIKKNDVNLEKLKKSVSEILMSLTYKDRQEIFDEFIIKDKGVEIAKEEGRITKTKLVSIWMKMNGISKTN